jgi:hypothetical protein
MAEKRTPVLLDDDALWTQLPQEMLESVEGEEGRDFIYTISYCTQEMLEPVEGEEGRDYFIIILYHFMLYARNAGHSGRSER